VVHALILLGGSGEALAAFEINRKLRASIYGEVRVGFRLTPAGAPGAYTRNTLRPVAIKVSNKVLIH
jgi:hypothetical protein